MKRFMAIVGLELVGFLLILAISTDPPKILVECVIALVFLVFSLVFVWCVDQAFFEK
jgi:hypothetical protein